MHRNNIFNTYLPNTDFFCCTYLIEASHTSSLPVTPLPQFICSIQSVFLSNRRTEFLQTPQNDDDSSLTCQAKMCLNLLSMCKMPVKRIHSKVAAFVADGQQLLDGVPGQRRWRERESMSECLWTNRKKYEFREIPEWDLLYIVSLIMKVMTV